VVSPEDAVRRANAELEDRVGDKLQLPLAVLINQRDRALRGLAEAHTHAEQSLRDLTTDHDRFVAFVMHENAQRVAALEATLQTERARAVRAEAQVATLGAVPERASQEFNQDLAEAQAEILELKEAVRLLEGEVEETRAEAVRLQGERDEAIRSTDDLRLDLLQDLEAARAEAADFQARFDATERALLDARDQARDEVAGLTEQIVELQRVADKRSV
jgi:predicted  nucleic acid-binding Zn-ribbon protein